MNIEKIAQLTASEDEYMIEMNLKRFVVLIILLSMLMPVAIGEVFAAESEKSDFVDNASYSRSDMERGAISGSDSKTTDVPENSPPKISGMSLETVKELTKESTSVTYLGKNPNLALDFTNMVPAYISDSRGSRDEPADNNWQGANVLTNNMALRNDSVGGTDTADWYSAALDVDTNNHDELKIEFTNKETTRGRNITIIIYDSYNQQYPLYNSRTWAYSAGGSTYTPGGIPANTTKEITVRAPRSGTYYMVVAPHPTETGTFAYSIDSVSISGKPPTDHNNQWESATQQDQTTFMGSLNQATNHWNWHNVSSHFKNVGMDFDNNLSYTMTISAESTGRIQELAAAGTFDWVTWTMVSILFNNDNDDWFMYHHTFWTGGSKILRFGNTVFNPESGWIVVNGTWAYIGVECISAFIWLDQNNEVHIDNWYTTGTSSYSMSIAVEELDLNYAPQVNFGKVTPNKGSINDNYTFEVKYTDLNNEAPETIKVIVDDKLEFPMELKPGETENYDQGVIFSVKVRGDAIGDDPYPHRYWFYSDDGRKSGRNPIQKQHEDLFIIKNEPPVLRVDRIKEHIMFEDDTPVFLDLLDIFEDPDGDTDWKNGHDTDGHTLDFYLRNEDDTAWGSLYLDDLVMVTLYNTDPTPTHIRITPLENKFGQSVIKLKAVDESLYESDLYTWEIEAKLTITLKEVNDGPVLQSVPDFTKVSAGALKEDEVWTFSFNATDVDDPVLMYSTNIEEVLTVGGDQVLTTDPHEYGYTFDAFSGTITLTPTNEFVGKHIINVSVTDNDPDDPKYDYDEFEIEILNVNDKPKITAVGKKDVIEGTALVFNSKQNNKLELQIYAEDPDIDIGEKDSLTYKMDVEQRENLLLDDMKGILTFIPNQEDVDNRRIFITLGVVDSYGALDEVEIRIQVENVNDPPILEDVRVVVVDADPQTNQPENLTVKFEVVNGYDPDGDTITYSWDFNALENLDNLGGSDDDAELIGTENIFHTYPSPGIYEVVVTAKDTSGATIKYNLTIDVKEPKEYFESNPDDEKAEDTGFWSSKYGGVTASVWIVVIVVALILTFAVIMFVIRKKGEEIERMRHAERFRQEAMGGDGLPVRPEEGAGFDDGRPKFPEEVHVAQSASELYAADSRPAAPSLFDMPPPQQLPGAAPMGMPPQQSMGGPMAPQPQQPLGLPPAAMPMQPGMQPMPAQMQQPGMGGEMKCTSCGTPINPEWYICPGCHRFLK